MATPRFAVQAGARSRLSATGALSSFCDYSLPVMSGMLRPLDCNVQRPGGLDF
jgi:hypothetical protein